MVKRTGPTNTYTRQLIESFRIKRRESNENIWGRLATELEMPTRQRRSVNLASINRNSDSGELIVVPGKVLGSGIFEKKLSIYALSFSKQAEEKIQKAGGKALKIGELLKSKIKKVRILG